MEQPDEDLDDVFNSEEYRYYSMNVDDQENSSEESICSSDLDTDDIFDTQSVQSQYQYRTAATKKEVKEHMEIKDVVKDNVLRFLPAKALNRFRAVSKDWDQKITSSLLSHQQSHCFRDISGFFCQNSYTNPSFVTLNPSAYGVPTPSLKFLPDLVDIRASSNGLLLCQGRTGNNSYYICNPANEQWKELDRPEYYHGSKTAPVLAFQPSEQNTEPRYKVICAVPWLVKQIVCFEIYSSETMSWRSPSVWCTDWDGSEFIGNGLYMRGMAYWETSTRKILAVALANENEICEIISLPSETPLEGVLAEINEELAYITASNYSGKGFSVNIYGGMGMGLIKKFDFHLDGVVGKGIQGCRVLTCANGDVVMILVGGIIYSYSLLDRRIEMVSKEAEMELATGRFFPYVNSLVRMA